LVKLLLNSIRFDPLIQYAAHYNFTVYPGNTYDYSPLNASDEARMYEAMYGKGNCYDQTLDCYHTGRSDICPYAEAFCTDEVEAVLDNIAHRDGYDIRRSSDDPFPETFYVDYLNTPKVQAAIGAYTNFSRSSSTIGAAFTRTGDGDHVGGGIIEHMRSLINDNITIVMYAGDADYYCNWLGVEAVAGKINPPGFRYAGYTDMNTSDGIVHGQVKQAGAFTFARIFESGHAVPYYQPLVSLEMFKRVLAGKDIATGEISVKGGSDYKTIGSKQSWWREGNSAIQPGKVSQDATYNTTTNMPNSVNQTAGATAKWSVGLKKADMRRVMRSPNGWTDEFWDNLCRMPAVTRFGYVCPTKVRRAATLHAN